MRKKRKITVHRITENHCIVKNIIFVAAALFLAGCGGGRAVRQAALIERDALLTCLSDTPNRCAISSEFQDLADTAFAEAGSVNTHYVSILDIGEDALLTRIHLVRAARESIDIQTFIWEDDEVGQLVFAELMAAARRGVKVRLILDQVGAFISVRGMTYMAIVHENIDLRFFRPVKNHGGRSTLRDADSFVTDLETLNKRMHNKLFVADGRIGIVGGRNIENAYYDYSTHVCFKDLDILVAGPVVRDMVVSFNKYWGHKLTKPALELPDVAEQALRLDTAGRLKPLNKAYWSVLEPLCQKADAYSIVSQRPTMKLYPVNHIEYVADRPGKRKLFKIDRWDSTRRVGELVSGAEYEVLVQTPYLIQDRKWGKGFKRLRKDRPDLRIALSTNSLASTDKFFVYAMCLKQRQFYLEAVQTQLYELKPVPGDVRTMIPRYMQLGPERNGQDVYEHPDLVLPEDIKGPRVIVHAKFFVVDGHISFVGSHNFDPRSKNLNTESAVIIRDEKLAKALKAIFSRDTAPQNSWVVARRQKVPLVGNVSELIAAISSSLPFFDIWPFEYSTNFELREGFEPLSPDHPDFYQHYRDVGFFPRMGLSYENIGTRFVKAFGGIFRDLM